MLKYVLQQYAIVTWLEHFVFIEIWGAPWNGRSVFKRRERLTPPLNLHGQLVTRPNTICSRGWTEIEF